MLALMNQLSNTENNTKDVKKKTYQEMFFGIRFSHMNYVFAHVDCRWLSNLNLKSFFQVVCAFIIMEIHLVKKTKQADDNSKQAFYPWNICNWF